jgi:predicted NAD-dependent protein-ADP-ribosyltransferase YbiA (DUF1768 family)
VKTKSTEAREGQHKKQNMAEEEKEKQKKRKQKRFRTNEECRRAGPERCLLFKSTRVEDGGAFLSNFWPDVSAAAAASAVRLWDVDLKEGSFLLEKERWLTVESWYQTQKFVHIDPDYADVLRGIKNAKEVKQAATKKAYIEWLRPERGHKAEQEREFSAKLDELKGEALDEIMSEGLAAKFTQNPSLTVALLKTSDRFLAEQGRKSTDYWAVTGENRLGQLLMDLRQELQDSNAAALL